MTSTKTQEGLEKNITDSACATNAYQNSVVKTIIVGKSQPPLSHLVIFSKGKFECLTHTHTPQRGAGKAGIV